MVSTCDSDDPPTGGMRFTQPETPYAEFGTYLAVEKAEANRAASKKGLSET